MTQEEFSYGIVPIRKHDSQWQVLLVQLHAGHWGFPKGHAEEGESDWDAAVRELREETNLEIAERIGQRAFDETYQCVKEGNTVDKRVRYFPALVQGELSTQEEEVAEVGWFALSDAEGRMTFPEGKQLCRTIIPWLTAKLPQQAE